MAITTNYSLSTTVSAFFGSSYTEAENSGATVVGTGGDGFLLSYRSDDGEFVLPLVDFYLNGTATRSRGLFIPQLADPAEVDLLGDPAMIRLADGNYAVVWDSGTQGGGTVRGTVFAQDGAPISRDFEVSPTPADFDPVLAALPGGNWVVVMSNLTQIVAQILSPTGAKIGGQATFSSSSNNNLQPVIAGLPDDGYAIAWTAFPGLFAPIGSSVWIAIRNADGTERVASTEIAIGAAGDDNTQPAMAVLQNGSIALVYKDSGWPGDGITLQIINSTTGTASATIRVDPPAFEGEIEQDPDVTVLANGMILVTWTRPFSATNNDILGRLFTASGVPLQVDGADHIAISVDATNQTHSSVAALLEGRFVTTWTDSDLEPGGMVSSVKVKVNQIGETLTSDASGDTMTGSGLRSTLFGGGGDDTIRGGGGRDTLFGGDGDDRITADGDGGLYDGGAGDDVMLSGNGGETMVGGAGTDLIDHRRIGGAYSFDMATGQTNLGNESFTGFETALMGAGSNSVSGTTGGDTIDGGAGDDMLLGQDGNDRLIGGAGRDSLDGGTGNDRLTGGGARDKLFGDAGHDRLDGGGGQDRLAGGDGNDTLSGGAGKDRLFGGAGADRLDGGRGADILDGGAGRDVFVFGQRSGRDRVLNFENGIDRIDLDGVAFADLTITRFSIGVRIRLDAGDQLELTGVTLNQIGADDFI
jgi:Ca2+-binding RTX toxin-like protein